MKNLFEWQDLEILQVNREKPGSCYIPYQTECEALSDNKNRSPYYKLLNGNWNFIYYDRFIDVPEDIAEPANYDYDWNELPVPSGAQICDYDIPHKGYPFSVDIPHVPHDNPTAVYSRAFFLPEAWDGREIYINFEGVSSCFYLYINGIEAGYSEGSHLPSEFNITKYLNDGENFITVKVLKYCTSSYLENCEFCNFMGIFRDVYLLARDKHHIKDIFIKPILDNEYKNGEIIIETDSENNFTVKLYDPSGVFLAETSAKGGKASFILENVKKWNAEQPELYKILIFCGDEIIPFDTGFLKAETCKNGALLINGVDVKLRATKLRYTHPELGYCTPYEAVKKELMQLKQHNINTIFTSYYPNTPEFLKLCNKYGFYVIDETGINLHGFPDGSLKAPCHHPDWKEAFVQSGKRMVERDKNNPCIIMWSLGNKSFYGDNYIAMANSILLRDNLRPLYCEGGNTDTSGYIYTPQNGNFFADGFASSDRIIKEIKETYKQLTAEPINLRTGEISICNKYDFINAQNFDMLWKISCDGKTLSQGRILNLDINPHSSYTCNLGYTLPHTCKFGCTLDISFVLNTDTPWAQTGYEIGFAQFEISIPVITEDKKVITTLGAEEDKEYIVIYGDDFTYAFSKIYGQFTSIVKDGIEMLAEKCDFSVWRAPTGSDIHIRKEWDLETGGYGFNHECAYVYDTEILKCEPDEIVINVKSNISCPSKAPFVYLDTTYAVDASGEISVRTNAVVNEHLNELPRFGMVLVMTAGNENIRYYGMGGGENYIDACHSAKLGMYSSTVTDEHICCIKPQENGNHIKTRFAAVYDILGRGIVFTGDPEFNFKASHFTSQELTEALHPDELQPRAETIVRIDYKHRGIKAGACDTSEEYRFNEKEFSFGFKMKPVNNLDEIF